MIFHHIDRNRIESYRALYCQIQNLRYTGRSAHCKYLSQERHPFFAVSHDLHLYIIMLSPVCARITRIWPFLANAKRSIYRVGTLNDIFSSSFCFVCRWYTERERKRKRDKKTNWQKQWQHMFYGRAAGHIPCYQNWFLMVMQMQI